MITAIVLLRLRFVEFRGGRTARTARKPPEGLCVAQLGSCQSTKRLKLYSGPNPLAKSAIILQSVSEPHKAGVAATICFAHAWNGANFGFLPSR